ncbi:MAG: CRTAC1 family protein, partial [Planctomycetota bacterium]|nr:CRTAC1 family protein [Planctomycetota bacterium]
VGPGDGASPLALAAADLDRDGRLDFVASGPVGASLYRQVAPGRFRVEGLFDRARTTSVTVLDADADGALDLVFAGVDGLRLLLGDGAGGFRPAGPAMGSLARRRDGEPEARSVGRGDLDGDGFPEVVSTHPRGDATTCHARDAESRYRDVARLSGLAAASRDASGQGVAIFDADNDGDLDIFVASGALREPASRRPRAAAERRLVYERSLFYLNDGGGHFREVGDDFGEAMAAARNVLAALAADLDRDGRLDLLLDRADGPPLVLWNRLRPRPWIRVRLEADPASSSPPEGIGARVEVEAGGRRQHRWVRRSRGHTSGPATVHFGLGDAAEVDVLWIRWPSGQVDRHGGVTAGRDYVAREGGALEPDPGSSPSKRG